MSELLPYKMSAIVDLCTKAISAGPISAGRSIVMTANTVQKAIAAETPLPKGAARPYLTRCGFARVLFHDMEDGYWDILFNTETKAVVSVQPWSGPPLPEKKRDYLSFEDYVF